MRSANLLRPLSRLALALALAPVLTDPAAAFVVQVDALQVAPVEPTSDDPVVLTVTGFSDTDCFGGVGVNRFQQTLTFEVGECPYILSPLQDTRFTFSREVGRLPAGTYRVLATVNGEVQKEQVLTVQPVSGPCAPGAAALCLAGGRFRVEADWEAHGQQGEGQVIGLTGETGAFAFFQPDNVEAVVKVVDGCELNGHFWVFVAGLTDVRTTLAVTDTLTGRRATYENPAGTPFAPIQDTGALLCSSLSATRAAAEDDVSELRVTPAQPYDEDPVTLHFQMLLDSPCHSRGGVERDGNTFDLHLGSCSFPPPPGPTLSTLDHKIGALPPGTYEMRLFFDGALVESHTFTVRESLGTCKPGPDVLCLGDRRFAVRADWQANGQEGHGQAADITRDSGRLSFFERSNVELVVKVLDACAFNGHFWLFAAGLTDVRTTLAVTDTVTGASRTYENPASTAFVPIQDTAALPCP